MTHPNSVLRCYRLTYTSSYDEEAVWAEVQHYGGHLSIRQDCIDFYIPKQWESLFVLKWSMLERRPDLDLVDHRI